MTELKRPIILVVPAYNEGRRFKTDYFLRIRNLSENLVIIFIDDGSADSTSSLLDAATKVVSDSLVLTLDRNHGKANAIREGFIRAMEMYPTTEWIGFLDADESFFIDDIDSVLSSCNKAKSVVDAIFTIRKVVSKERFSQVVQRQVARHMVFSFLVLGWGQHPDDTQSGFKFFRTSKPFMVAIKDKFETHWFFEWELLIRLRSMNSWPNILQIPVNYAHQEYGNIRVSNYPQIFSELLFIKSKQIKLIINSRS